MAELEHSSLTEFVDRKTDSNYSAQVVNPTASQPIKRMVTGLFEGMSIDLSPVDMGGMDEDLFLLLNDGEVVESTPLTVLKETLLLVNSDLYRTGTVDFDDIEFPDVIMGLSDKVFTLRGYPVSDGEKLVLTMVSRYVEHRAWQHDGGTLRTGFQRLSRLDDERGTREVYKRIGQESGTDVAVYGLPDWKPPDEFELSVHGVSDPEIKRHWFVVHRTDDDRGVAMLAATTGRNEWRGFWTFDPAEIRSLDRYVQRTF